MSLIFAKTVRPVAPPATTKSASALVRGALLALLVLMLALAGCGGGGGGGGGGGASTVVRGMVLDSANSDQGLQGATITIGGVTATTRTVDNANSDNPVGSFVINNPQTNSTTAVITPVGQAPQTVAFEPPVQSGTTTDVELYVNIGQVRGRILLPNGSPATNAFVTVSTPTNVDTVQANANGTFLVSLIQTGEASVTIVQGTAAASRTITVQNGLNDLGDITLAEDPNAANPPGLPATITGKVAVENGASPAGSSILLLRNGIQIESTVADANGNYNFYVPVGTYGIRILRDGYNTVDKENVVVSNASTPLSVETVTLTPVQ